jgi:hypothetical protein
MAEGNRNLVDAKKRAQDSMERADLERRQKLFELRLQTVQKGITAFQRKDIPDAIRNYRLYLKILEGLKGLSDGALLPSHFTSPEEKKELLIISGVYWDLVKIYDKSKTDSRKNEFRHYVEKYILFSHQMPFQPFCAELVRKYIAFGKMSHAAEFKNIYRILGSSKCFIVSSLVDLTEFQTLDVFRSFRDEILSSFFLGKILIRMYCFFSPSLAFFLDKSPFFLRAFIAKQLDFLASLISKRIL